MPPKNLIPPPRRRGIFAQVLVLFRNLATTLAISLYVYTVLSSAGKYCQQKDSSDKGQLCTFIRQNSNQWKTWTASAPPAFRSPVTDSKGQRAPLEMTLGVGGIPLVLSLYLVFLWVLGDANRVTQDTALVATTLIVVQNVFFVSPVDSDALTILAIAISFVLPIGRGSSGDVFSTLSVMYGFAVLAYASLQVVQALYPSQMKLLVGGAYGSLEQVNALGLRVFTAGRAMMRDLGAAILKLVQ